MSAIQQEIADKVEIIKDIFSDAVDIEKMLPDREVSRLKAKSGWPDYVYDAEDRKDQEPEALRRRASPKQIDLYDYALGLLRYLGMRRDKRTVMGKKIVWAKASGFSFREIGFVTGVPPKTCENWYKRDIYIIARRLE